MKIKFFSISVLFWFDKLYNVCACSGNLNQYLNELFGRQVYNNEIIPTLPRNGGTRSLYEISHTESYLPFSTGENQRCVSGSALILVGWICLRIRTGKADPDPPDPGQRKQKWTIKTLDMHWPKNAGSGSVLKPIRINNTRENKKWHLLAFSSANFKWDNKTPTLNVANY
jgi:hypothetical protein